MLGDFDRSRRSSAGDTFDFSLRSAHDELAKTDEGIKDSSAWTAVHAQIEAVMMDVPEDHAAVLPWLLSQSHSDLIDLLAVLTSISLYRRESNSYCEEPRHLDRLGEVISLEISKWWKPTAQSYLAHVSKDRIAAVARRRSIPSRRSLCLR